MSDEIVIKVKSVSKNFVLPHEKITSIKSAFTGIYRRKKRSRETHHALHDISFEVKKGEFFGIVGRNGSGKSTLLKILANIYQPTQGKVQTRGKLVPFIELGVGFNPELTGRENIYLNGAMLGFSRNEIDAMYDDIVAFAELERFMDQKLKNYSSGMQVRLAFSMATRSEADILLVDEVLAVGDADFQRKCFNYFRELKRRNRTVVFVSHDMNAIREYCDRAVLIEQSKLVKIGSSDVVATAYSRMFIEHSTASKTMQESKRWGTKDAVFTDVSLSTKKMTDKYKNLTIHTTITAHKELSNVAIGFFVKNAIGTPIIGTNNQILKKNIKHLEKGKVLKLNWVIPNIFSEGTHFVTLALEADSVTCDWWEDAASFNVFLERNTPYATSPPIVLEEAA